MSASTRHATRGPPGASRPGSAATRQAVQPSEVQHVFGCRPWIIQSGWQTAESASPIPAQAARAHRAQLGQRDPVSVRIRGPVVANWFDNLLPASAARDRLRIAKVDAPSASRCAWRLSRFGEGALESIRGQNPGQAGIQRCPAIAVSMGTTCKGRRTRDQKYSCATPANRSVNRATAAAGRMRYVLSLPLPRSTQSSSSASYTGRQPSRWRSSIAGLGR
jgi:hypothetical protein